LFDVGDQIFHCFAPRAQPNEPFWYGVTGVYVVSEQYILITHGAAWS
jgi:hypothetical protein